MYSVVLLAALTTGGNAPDCWFKHGCYGGYGCHGCYGGYGCWGCYGGYGCHGCYGGYGCYGCAGCFGGYGYNGHGPMYYMPPAPPAGGTTPEALPKPKPDDKTTLPNRARVIVQLPADARLFIDDQMMRTPSARRVFNTPSLEAGQAYYYILRAEVVRDGQTFSDTKQVVVRAGAEVQANFNDLELTAVAAKATTTARR